MEPPLLVRRARPEDSLRIWEIRNTLQSRQASINQDEVAWEKHEPWFQQKYIASEANACFALDYMGKTVGYCRFDSENDSFRVSIALDPAYHSRGFGGLFLLEVCTRFGEHKTLIAEVRKENESSFRIFEKAGFNVTSEDDTYSHFERRAQ